MTCSVQNVHIYFHKTCSYFKTVEGDLQYLQAPVRSSIHTAFPVVSTSDVCNQDVADDTANYNSIMCPKLNRNTSVSHQILKNQNFLIVCLFADSLCSTLKQELFPYRNVSTSNKTKHKQTVIFV